MTSAPHKLLAWLVGTARCSFCCCVLPDVRLSPRGSALPSSPASPCAGSELWKWGPCGTKLAGCAVSGQPSLCQLVACPVTEQLGAPCTQALHDAYGGWLDEQSVADFAGYAEVVFRALGHRVTNWSTFNEPWTFVEVRQGRTLMLVLGAQAAAGTLGLPNHMLLACQSPAIIFMIWWMPGSCLHQVTAILQSYSALAAWDDGVT